MENVLKSYNLSGKPERFGDGHINITYNLNNEYVIQRINTEVFPNPAGVMDNCWAVTNHIRNKLAAEGKSTERQTLEFVPTVDGKPFYQGEEGTFRVYKFIDEAYTLTNEKTPDILYKAAKAIGKFQQILADFDAEKLFTVIPDFHNTPKRVENLKKSVEKNASGRAGLVKEEIEFAYDVAKMAGAITDAIADGSVPLRVSHNDTKLNNVLFDANTDDSLCLIDLDTVMSGSYLYDFGDAMRFGASTAAEDCTDLDKVNFDLEIFEAFTKGYLECAGDILTDGEKKLIYTSVILMTYECGIRFLADYIDGDVYFRTHYDNHNLDRARNQFKLVKDMLAKKEQGEAIVKKYL